MPRQRLFLVSAMHLQGTDRRRTDHLFGRDYLNPTGMRRLMGAGWRRNRRGMDQIAAYRRAIVSLGVFVVMKLRFGPIQATNLSCPGRAPMEDEDHALFGRSGFGLRSVGCGIGWAWCILLAVPALSGVTR